MAESLIIHCYTCEPNVSWDLDMDPPKCENDDHVQELVVVESEDGEE